MRYIRLIFGLALLLAAGLPAIAASNAADTPHVHVQLVFPVPHIAPGAMNNQAGLYFKLEPGWHVYWENAGDSGEPPQIKWTLPKGIFLSPLEFPAPQRLPLGPLMDYGYENEVLFPFMVGAAQGLKPGAVTLHADVAWLVCSDRCIPGKAQLEEDFDILSPEVGGDISLVYAPDQTLFQRLANRLPEPLPLGDTAVFQPTSTGFRLAVTTGQKETQAAFFPEAQDIIDNAAPQAVTATANGLTLDLKKDPNLTASPAQMAGVLELSGGRNYELTATPGNAAGGPTAPSQSSLLRIVGFAFLGGLLLNLMPCVFPVLFLKGLALCQCGIEERHKLRAHGFFYAAGIMISFWALVGALLVLRAAGGTLGWGFQFQSPVFLALMAGLLFFLGLSLAGQFEIGLSLTSAGGSLAAKQGYAGSFFTGVLAVVVATPCTAPFMAAAIGYALAQPAGVTFAVFTALALGLAAPYVALTLQPAWTRVLPKPGAWMEILKQAVSLFMFGSAIWLAWVVAQAYGAGLLAALLSTFLLLAVAGWFLGRWPAQRWATVVAGLIVLLVIAACVEGPKKLAESPEALGQGSGLGSGSGSGGGQSASHAAWQPWSAEAVSRAVAAGQPVFVDFTAGWCLSCQVNERVALSQPEVMQAFAGANVLLLRADWTREDPAITQALTALGRSGVPVYALYTPGQSDPELLPQVLTPGIVIDAVAKLPKTAAAK